MSGLDGLQLDMFDTSPPPDSEPEPPRALVRITKTRAGHDILVATCDDPPKSVIDQAQAERIPLFTPREIPPMTDCDPELLERILQVKRQFPGCTVMQIIEEGAA